MSNLISVVTCTGSRPEALFLCGQYLAKQTIAKKIPIQWIVVDDEDGAENDDPVAISGTQISIEYYKGPRIWSQGVNTHRFNMEMALSKVKGQVIINFEDDDHYAPTYIETMLSILQYADIVGESNVKYFNLQVPGYKEMRNYTHSSLCSTAVTRKAVPLLAEAVNSGDLYFDIVLWKKAHEAKIPMALYSNLNLVVGIKGMPGRPNIGAGANKKDYLVDQKLVKLQEWIGEDAADNYLPFARKLNERRNTSPGKSGALTPSNRSPNQSGGAEPRVPTTSLQRTDGNSQSLPLRK